MSRSEQEDDLLYLDIDRINALSSYVVTRDEDGRAFVFTANNGLKYTVSFSPDSALVNIGKVYNIILASHPQLSVKSDPGIQQTICAVLSEFFHDHTRVASYACSHEIFKDRHETDHPYQTLRSRLFNIWYTRSNKDDLYEKLDVNIDGGEQIHFSVIFCRNYPDRKKLTKEFDRLKYYLTSDDEK